LYDWYEGQSLHNIEYSLSNLLIMIMWYWIMERFVARSCQFFSLGAGFYGISIHQNAIYILV
jgi:hypothetical protein